MLTDEQLELCENSGDSWKCKLVKEIRRLKCELEESSRKREVALTELKTYLEQSQDTDVAKAAKKGFNS
jgi:hypothetical protein